MSDAERFNVACAERGIISAEGFRERFGMPLPSLRLADALTLIALPPWVTDTWLPNAGQTRVVWVPSSVREYGRLVGIEQRPDEDDDQYTRRIQVAYRKGIYE